MVLTVFKGTQFSVPSFFRFSSSPDWEYEYSLDTPYLHPGEQQNSWMKLTGLKSNFFRPTHHSLMVAFRYVPHLDKFQLGFYRHDNGKRILPPEDSPIFVSLKEKFRVSMFFVNGEAVIKMELPQQDADYTTLFQTFKSPKFYYFINLWLGGRLPSPINFKAYFKKWK